MNARRKLLDTGRDAAAREFTASAMYMAIVLLAFLVVVPEKGITESAHIAWIIVGSALGLTVAHWFAFCMATHIHESHGVFSREAGREAGSQIAGGLAVAIVAAAPFLIFESEVAIWVSLGLLTALPALGGFAIGRMRKRSWVEAAIGAVIVLVIAVGVVLVKAYAGH